MSSSLQRGKGEDRPRGFDRDLCLSVWEVARLERAGRMKLETDLATWLGRALAHERTEVVPVTREITLRAASLESVHDPSDQVIFATAVEHDAILVSGDRFLQDLDPSRVVW
jgi:PIN domain nuclease of toxin-antitoxin system